MTAVAPQLLDPGEIVFAGLSIGPEDGEVRPEALEPGDAVRWLRRWHEVTRVQVSPWGTYLWLVEEDSFRSRVVTYRRGVWVAARCRRRDELPA